MFALLKAASRKRQLIEQARYLSEIPKDAFTLIVGGGIVGTSVAYHLTLRGVRDIVLLERGKLADEIALHSPGLVSSAHPIHRYKPFLAWSVELYASLEAEAKEKLEFSRTGTLRLATSETRLDEFRRYTARDYFQKGDVAKTTLIDADKVKNLAPILDTKTVLGALYTSGDGYINAQNLTLALAKGAEKRGAVLVEQCPKIKAVEEGRTDWVVKFDDGSQVRTRNIVNAAGLWAREFGRLTNLDIPLVIVEHQYAHIGPLPEVEPLVDLPAIIDHESSFYIHRVDNSVLFGGFEQKPSDIVIREDWIEHMPEVARIDDELEIADYRIFANNEINKQQKSIEILKDKNNHESTTIFSSTDEPLLGDAFLTVQWIQACSTGDLRKVGKLIKEKPYLISYAPAINHGFSGLHYAAKDGQSSVVRFLVMNGADVNLRTSGYTPLHLAAISKQLEIISILLRDC
ncbi:Dimethylglycine dehydrogenase, partial [Dirofilaria immitis]